MTAPDITYRLVVWRVDEGEYPDTPIAWDHHRARRAGVHAALDANPAWGVHDWDEAERLNDEKRTHEWAEIILFLKDTVLPAATPVVQWVAEEAVKAGISAAVGEAIKTLFDALRAQQDKKTISDVTLEIGDTAAMRAEPASLPGPRFKMALQLYPREHPGPDYAGRLFVHFPDGRTESFDYAKDFAP